MESKFVSKAKTALHNAAAKAERVLTEIKADLVAELSAHSQGSEGELPWVGRTEHEKKLEDECRKRILKISKSPNFLFNEQDGRIDVNMHSARAVLEFDENLRNLWVEYIPKRMKEKEFWKRYFAAVKRVKQEILEFELDSESVVSSTDLKSGPDTGGEAFELESPRKDPAEEESYKKALTVVAIPPSIVVRRLAYAIQFAKAFETITDLAALGVTDKDSSQGSDWSSLVSGLSVVRKLSLRDKDGKLKAQNKDAGRYHSLLWSLFDADMQYEDKDISVKEFLANRSKLPEELHGAPPESFVTQLAEIIAGVKTEQKMAEFWLEIVKECRNRWRDGQPIPRMPVDANPDLSYCLLLQQLQVINSCIARRKRRVAAIQSLNALQGRRADSDTDSCMLCAKLKDGKLVPRLGVDRQAADLRMLETGEPIYSPITQEGPVLTEDLIKETEELVLRTGSFGAGCSQLFSDMQAFKAANPGCILEDFVRWYSPLDWRQEPASGLSENKNDDLSLRGHLSARMKCEGNLWQELWFSARAIPAVAQAPLFDEELAGESTLDALESIAPADFFEQLFTTTLSAGFAIAEAAPLAKKDPLKKCLKECRDYILSTCHRHMDSETLEHLCEVYEFMETVLHAPPEELASEVKVISDAVKPDLKAESKTAIASMHFAELGRLLNKKQVIRDQHCQPTKGDGPVSSVVRFFESKASLFERKSKQGSAEEEKKISSKQGSAEEEKKISSKQGSAEEEKKISSAESDWTIV